MRDTGGSSWFISEHERYADGLTTCEQCIARHPQLAEAYEWRGHMLKDLDRYEEARLSYEEAHRLDPKDEGILLSQTRLLLRMKHIDEALAMCEQAILLAPAQPSAYQVKGDILIRMKRYEEALSANQKVVQLDPKDASAHAHLGDILTETGAVCRSCQGV